LDYAQEAPGGLRSDLERRKSDLAQALHDILARLYTKLQDPDYNYVINTAARYKAYEPQLHWYLQIWPRLTTQSGFELGSGMTINPSIPEGRQLPEFMIKTTGTVVWDMIGTCFSFDLPARG